MKIISKFKDYYDYVSNNNPYGFDDEITYDRKSKTVKITDEFMSLYKRIKYKTRTHIDDFKYDIKPENDRFNSWEFCMHRIFIGGYEYGVYVSNLDRIAYEQPDYNWTNTTWIAPEYKEEKYKGINSAFFGYGIGYYPDGWHRTYTKEINKDILNFQKYLGMSIVFMDNYYNYKLDEKDTLVFKVPRLQNIKYFASQIPAETVSNQIRDFFLDMRNNPPYIPTNMDDKTKIQKHGFDVKKSFRHRK